MSEPQHFKKKSFQKVSLFNHFLFVQHKKNKFDSEIVIPQLDSNVIIIMSRIKINPEEYIIKEKLLNISAILPKMFFLRCWCRTPKDYSGHYLEQTTITWVPLKELQFYPILGLLTVPKTWTFSEDSFLLA